MITLNDCKAFCDADPATVARVARQEQLPEIQAIACTQSRLMKARPLHARNHAKIGAATLSVFCDSEQLRLVVSDAGCGFTVDRVDGGLPGNDRFGLASIHERMSAIGGQMKIDSRPGHGATITLTLPCAIAAKASAP